jgi:hypothetical protein
MRDVNDGKSMTWWNNKFVSAVRVFMPESIVDYKEIHTISYEGHIFCIREAVRSPKILQPLEHLEEARVIDFSLH